MILGQKKQEMKKKTIFLEKISEFKDEIKQFLDKATISKEIEFLTFLYKNI